MRTLSPILRPRVSMVTSFAAAGDTALEEALETVETVDTGERVPGKMETRLFGDAILCTKKTPAVTVTKLNFLVHVYIY